MRDAVAEDFYDLRCNIVSDLLDEPARGEAQ